MRQVQIPRVLEDSPLLCHLMHPSTEHQHQQIRVDWGIALSSSFIDFRYFCELFMIAEICRYIYVCTCS